MTVLEVVMSKREQIEKILQEEAGLQTKYFKILIDRILALDDDIRTATLDEVRPEVEKLLTDETVIANCINLETLNKAIDSLRGNDE